jgi:DNA recombination protein RmuC
MDVALLIIILIAIVILGILILRQRPSNEIVEWLKSTGGRLESQNKSINERLDNAANVISAVQRNIGEMSEIGRGMKDLQQFLSSPKLRGNIGEQVLKELLGQMLPKASFNLQYTFKSGEKVDAAIKTSAGIIPIDSKFPMENFRKLPESLNEFVRDVKKHIDDISRKYILTEEGTIDYALMYIPSESVYYEIVNNQELFDYASSKRILPVSPTTFYAYIKAILMSFEGQKIEAQAKEILSSLRAIQKDYSKVDEALAVLQKHVVNSYNTIGTVSDAFGKLGQKITSTSSLGDKEEKKELE